MKKDYYAILGVSKNAALMDIKRAYRSLALECHPDRVPDYKKKEAEASFREIHEAYEVLSDLKRRREHDSQAYSDVNSPGRNSGESNFFDYFKDFIEEILYHLEDRQKRTFIIVVIGYILIAVYSFGWQILYNHQRRQPLSSLMVGIFFSYFFIFPKPVVTDFPIDHEALGYRILRYLDNV